MQETNHGANVFVGRGVSDSGYIAHDEQSFYKMEAMATRLRSLSSLSLSLSHQADSHL